MRGALESNHKISGHVKLYSLPPDLTYQEFKKLKDKDQYLVDEGKNLVVDAGLQHILNLILGTDTLSFSYCGVGSGTTAPIFSNTDLETEISPRRPVTDPFRTNLTAHFSTYFNTNENNGTWAESIIADSLTGGDILCRRLFASPYSKTSSNAAIIDWSVTIAAVADT